MQYCRLHVVYLFLYGYGLHCNTSKRVNEEIILCPASAMLELATLSRRKTYIHAKVQVHGSG